MSEIVTQEHLTAALKERLQAEHVEIIDNSGGCGSAYEVIIVSSLFEGKSLLERHRLVNEKLKDEIAKIHAFSQKSYTPTQWSSMNQTQK
ncbi:bola protein [Jimgerdemannia flammicorona]|uniref:Bola protein n=1 Tax=Jimgerdemannia flammicorona TaxID=994334 RepID=A0A433B9U2_9FUNG|nr:bola protein [Jimgerdemannia flammicorona]